MYKTNSAKADQLFITFDYRSDCWEDLFRPCGEIDKSPVVHSRFFLNLQFFLESHNVTLYDTLCSCISVMFHKGDIVFTIAEEL